MDEKAWRSVLEKISKTVKKNPDLDEPNTKTRIIGPLLQHLGWEALEGQVIVEYPVKFGSQVSNVDYALMMEGSPAVFVEVKALKTDLSSDDARDLIQAGRRKGVNWCLLTNGRELRIYNSEWLDSETDSTQTALVESIDWDSILDKVDLLENVSRKSIESGQTGQAFKRIRQTKETIEDIKANRNDIESVIQSELSEHAGELLKDKIDHATSRFVGQLLDELSSYPDKVTPQEPATELGSSTGSLLNLPMKNRNQLLRDYKEGTVIVTPSSPELVDEETGFSNGLGLFQDYHSWGFLRIGEGREVDYLALYVTSPESKVKYFAKVKEVVNPRSTSSPLRNYVQEREDRTNWHLGGGKKVLVLEANSRVEIDPPIEVGNVPQGVPRNSWYTSLQKFVTAGVTDDLKR